jgi:hypothetical protein
MSQEKPQDQAKAERLTASEPVRVTKPAESKPKPAPIPRTAVKTQRLGLGHYASLNGAVNVQRQEDGSWTLRNHDEVIEAGYKTSDQALTAAVEQHGYKLGELNTRPAKPKVEKPAPTKPEAKEEGVNERRSGGTGKAPRKTRPASETIHTRRSRAVKVG